MNPNLRLSKTGMLRSIVLIVIFLQTFYYTGVTQEVVFSPAVPDNTLLQNWFEKYEQHYRAGLSALPEENKEDFEKIYNQRWSNIKSKFDNKEIYTEAAARQYLELLVAEIVKANPVLKNAGFQCYFSRSGVPNASYIGEGIILINMGLFHRLENESQAAFVICHEISHYLLQHSENAIKSYVNTINSEEVQMELRKIKGSEYRKREQLEKLVKGLTFSNLRHSRGREGEADSMAVVLLQHTRFSTPEALTTLALLDIIDTDTLNTANCLQRFFNAPKYPFQKRWIAKEEGLLGGHAKLQEDKELADSLKTHPDCKQRIEKLRPVLTRYPQTSAAISVIDSSLFEKLQSTFRYEIIEFTWSIKNYSRSLFYTLEMLGKNPSDPYLVAQAGKILNGFYAAQKEHTLSKFTDLPSPDYPSNYNLLLQFIQNLYPENFASVSYHFLNGHHPQLDYYGPFKKEYSASIMIAQQ